MGTDPVAAYVDSQALGRIERRVQLGGSVPLDSGSPARATVCLTTRGLWLVAARDALRGTAVNLLARPDLEIGLGRLRGSLGIDEHRLSIPPHRRQDVLDLVAIGRLRAGGHPTRRPPARGRHIDSPSDVEQQWLAVELRPEELLLAWLRSSSQIEVPSTILEEARATMSLVLTDERVLLVAISPVGDVVCEAAAPVDLELDDTRSPVMLATRTRQLSSLRRDAALYREVFRVSQLEGAARLLEMARLDWLDRPALGPEPCRSLLDAAARRGHGLARLGEYLVSAALDEADAARPALEPALDWLAAGPTAPEAVADLWESWQHSEATALALVTSLRAHGARSEPWAVRLHERVNAGANGSRREGIVAAGAGLRLADHLLSAGQRARAIEVTMTALGRLPSAPAYELQAPSDAEPSTESEERRLRTQAYELLAVAGGPPGTPEVGALLELARLHPLSAQRLRDLMARAEGELRDRAEDVLELLQPEALGAATEPPARRHRPLPDTVHSELLRHPLTRADSPLLSKLQTLLALVPAVDYSALRDYCEKLSSERVSPALTALGEAAAMLGVDPLEAFVSRGAKGVGLRAYEGSPPFILIGGQHLDPTSRYAMTPAELRFALGAELAHLAFGHHRVTANEVWAGAMTRGREGLDLALGMLPVLRGWRIADRLVSATARIPVGPVKKILTAAQELNERVGVGRPEGGSGRNRDVISALNEDFLVAHRVMQLSADRAGLVLAGNLRAAVRAMHLVRRDYEEDLQVVRHRGLPQALRQRTDDGHLAYLDLAIRVAALIAFYLSDDYDGLTTVEVEAEPNV